MTYVPVKCECGCVFWSATSHCPNCNAPVKPQARPIDANALIAEQCGQCDGACEMFDGKKCLACKADCHCDLREAIDNAPTLDYAPVRHGRFGFVGGSAISVYVNFGTCSECKERVAWYQHKNFCPNCGARMNAKEEV